LHTGPVGGEIGVSGRIGVIAIGGLVLLASCGRPDSSGVYLSRSDRQAALIQLTQTKDGGVSGRVEVMSIGVGGTVGDESRPFDGVASNHELALKSAGAGVGPSATFSGDTLTISLNGAPLKARKASLGDFQRAVAQLRAKAAGERRLFALSQADRAVGAVEAGDIKDAATLGHAVTQLESDTVKLDHGVSAAPNFGQQAAGNTARIAQMARAAPTLSGSQRRRLAASVNQVIVETNQIDIARTQYAIGLDQIVQRASPVATQVQRFCDTPQAAQLVSQCTQAKAAATGFQSALVHGSVVLKGYKQTIQTELARQNETLQRIGG
jgi:hypothetical protein